MWILPYQRMVAFHEGPKLGVKIGACNRVIHKVPQRASKRDSTVGLILLCENFLVRAC